MAEKQASLEYRDRAELDDELNAAIGEILSAEEQAKRSVEHAEASVKAVQLDGATRERAMREDNARAIAEFKERAVADAVAKADEECKRLVSAAEENGKILIASKRKSIEKRAAELFDMIGDV